MNGKQDGGGQSYNMFKAATSVFLRPLINCAYIFWRWRRKVDFSRPPSMSSINQETQKKHKRKCQDKWIPGILKVDPDLGYPVGTPL